MKVRSWICCLAFMCTLVGSVWAQDRPAAGNAAAEPSRRPQAAGAESSPNFMEQSLTKRIDNLMWYQLLGDIADIDIVRYAGPPPRVIPNPTAQGAGNPVIITAFTFLPKKHLAAGKLPLIVLVHGGVHGDFATSAAHIVRELIQQGYAIIAPDYRGSTGYGRSFYRLIDYGGLENDDVVAGKQWMLENHPEIDSARVGIMGWSHGGMITLMTIFNHPQDFKVAYAGVPVSDLVARMGYKGEGYRAEYSAPYHLGKTAEENVNEYRRRSPAWNAEKLQTPLLIHTNTNDEDVNELEVEHLIQALKAANKKFDYKIYQNAPGGHMFNRIDTTLAQESRGEVYRFLAQYLNPPNPVK
ncbi:MAG: alpha/beta fold hydrolase [Acidobacteriia bacterium]|nr:alpha/beta fold hydrolase [Terriglobia bacterium]